MTNVRRGVAGRLGALAGLRVRALKRNMDTPDRNRVYRFGEFELDLRTHQLRRDGNPVALERRPLEFLILLVTHRDRLVRREEIIERLWPGNVVIEFDTGLNTLVRKVRKALGDASGAPTFVETVTGIGYRFIAAVDEQPTDQADSDDAPTQSASSAAPLRPPATSTPALRLRRATIAFAGIALVAVAALWSWRAPTPAPEQISIAVLPFENLTGQPDLDFLAAGLAEDTSVSLSQIDLPGVAVIGGVSARALTSSPLPLLDLGRANGIDFFVQSSLRFEAPYVRVNARLIRTLDGEQAWSASFDRELTNVLGLQRELSVAIAEQVRQSLSPDVAAAIDRRQTQNPEAYKLYLKGRYEWGRFLPNSVPQAIAYYREAVETDPSYGLAWAGISHALVTSIVTAAARPRDVIGPARDALERAVATAPDLAETLLAQGSFDFFLGWNCAAAEVAARRAVKLDPNNAMAHMFLGIVLSRMNNTAEATAMMRRARELDPLFPLLFANSAIAALRAGDAQAAQEFATQAIAINPEFWVGYMYRGRALLAQGDINAALDALTESERYSPGHSAVNLSMRAYALAKLGRIDDARAILEALQESAAERYIPPSAIARVHAGLGETDKAFAWLERALDERDPSVLGIGDDETFALLRSDPRFVAYETSCRTVP